MGWVRVGWVRGGWFVVVAAPFGGAPPAGDDDPHTERTRGRRRVDMRPSQKKTESKRIGKGRRASVRTCSR